MSPDIACPGRQPTATSRSNGGWHDRRVLGRCPGQPKAPDFGEGDVARNGPTGRFLPSVAPRYWGPAGDFLLPSVAPRQRESLAVSHALKRSWGVPCALRGPSASVERGMLTELFRHSGTPTSSSTSTGRFAGIRSEPGRAPAFRLAQLSRTRRCKSHERSVCCHIGL